MAADLLSFAVYDAEKMEEMKKEIAAKARGEDGWGMPPIPKPVQKNGRKPAMRTRARR